MSREQAHENAVESGSTTSLGVTPSPSRPLARSDSHTAVAAPFVRAERLTKTYETGRNRVAVFKDLSLEIFQGEMVAVIGPSGAGKSTLLHLLGGLDRPNAGTVKVAEFDIFKLGDVDLARFRNGEIGFIFQFHYLLPEFTAVENTMMPLLIARKSRQAAFKQAQSMLKSVGLADRVTHKPGELSGGEQALTALALLFAVFMTNPAPICVLDEVDAPLDDANVDRFCTLLADITGTTGTRALVVTHHRMTMARMDRLFGVTMAERGVSKLVSVDLKAAEELRDSAA